MARTTTFRFGPGSLESLELRVWTKPVRTRIGGTQAGDPRHLGGRLVGQYVVYAPSGEYVVSIDESLDAWETERMYEARLLAGARDGDEAAAHELANLLVEYALDGWADPADEYEHEYELEAVA